MSKFVAGHVCKMNYHILNRNFALKLQGNCWEDYVLTFSSHLSVTIKRLHVTSRSKRSDSGERCEVKIAMKSRGGLGRAFIFSRSFFRRTPPHYLNAWNRLHTWRSHFNFITVTSTTSRVLVLRVTDIPTQKILWLFQYDLEYRLGGAHTAAWLANANLVD